jgi:hypothetical protein
MIVKQNFPLLLVVGTRIGLGGFMTMCNLLSTLMSSLSPIFMISLFYPLNIVHLFHEICVSQPIVLF